MLESLRRRAAQSVLAALTACCLPVAASAGTINIILSNMDVTYLGSAAGGTGSLFDAMGGISGGGLNAATADDISNAVFELDNVVQGSIMSSSDPLHGDLRIDGVGPTIPKNLFLPAVGSNGGLFGFDFFSDSGLNLRITTDVISLFLSNGAFFFTGEGMVVGQNLPFGLVFDTSIPVQYSFTATLPSVPGTAVVSSAMGSGAFTISGIAAQVIPEPATGALLCTGLVLLGLVLIQRRRPFALAVVRRRRN